MVPLLVGRLNEGGSGEGSYKAPIEADSADSLCRRPSGNLLELKGETHAKGKGVDPQIPSQ